MIWFPFFDWSRFVIFDGSLREAPQLASVLREMKEGLDVVRSKVEALTAKVPILVLQHLIILLDSTRIVFCFVCVE